MEMHLVWLTHPQGNTASHTPVFPKGLGDSGVGSSLFSGPIPDMSRYHGYTKVWGKEAVPVIEYMELGSRRKRSVVLNGCIEVFMLYTTKDHALYALEKQDLHFTGHSENPLLPCLQNQRVEIEVSWHLCNAQKLCYTPEMVTCCLVVSSSVKLIPTTVSVE